MPIARALFLKTGPRTGWRCASPATAIAIVITIVMALHTAVHAAPKANDKPANEPRAIIEALLGRDFRDKWRYTGGHESFEYQPIFESYPPYDIVPLDKPIGQTRTSEETPTFGKCTQEMLVKDIKVTRVQSAADPNSSIQQPRALTGEVYVTVEAEVLALRLFNPEKIPDDRRCSWLGLEVQNTQTGKREAYFDHADDGKALLKMMKQFGRLEGDYVLIDPHRRHWSYGIRLVLPKSGKGLRRHYQHTTPTVAGKYVDAIEPRWLIQDPFPPRAVYLGAAIKQASERAKYSHTMALEYCRIAIKRETGKSLKKPDFQHPACGKESSAPSELKAARFYEAMLKILRSIQ